MTNKTLHVTYEFATGSFEKVLMNNIVDVDESIMLQTYGKNWEDEEGYNNEDLEIYQWFATSIPNEEQVLQLVETFPELLFAYSSKLDTFFLAVDHCGTAWRSVETEISNEGDIPYLFENYILEYKDVRNVTYCKYCNNRKKESFTIEMVKQGNKTLYQVHCLNCSAVGPLCESKEAAVEVWNKGSLEK